MKTLKRFTIDIKAQTFVGPAQYMEEQGNDKLAAICAGRDEVFNMFQHESPDLETAILVHMQTDYAAWKGFQESKTWAAA